MDRAIADYNEAIRINPRFAEAYVDRGFVWAAKDDYSLAIADYSEAIRIDPNLPEAYNSRAIAWEGQGEFARAIADYNEAIRIAPKFAKAYLDRAIALNSIGEFDKVIVDLNMAISINPGYAQAYFIRGWSSYYAGLLDGVTRDLSEAVALEPQNAYYALWLEIAERRIGTSGHLATQAGKLDLNVWPGPIVRLYLGQISAAEARAAALNPDAIKQRNQLCEYNFFDGQLEMMEGHRQNAIPLYRAAVNECPHKFTEWTSAKAVLRQLATP